MSKNNQSSNKSKDFPSLNLIFDLLKDRIALQWQQTNALDNKANFILVSATALVSAALVLQAVLLTPQTAPVSQITSLPFYCPTSTNRILHSLPLLILLAVYLFVMLSAYLAYQIRVYKQAPEPDELFKYLIDEEDKTMEAVTRAMLEVCKSNNLTIRSKVLRVKIAFILLGFEVLALVAYLFFQVTC